MILVKYFKTFAIDTSGAITTDWTLITALIIGLSLAVMVAVGQSSENLATAVGSKLTEQGNIDTVPDGS